MGNEKRKTKIALMMEKRGIRIMDMVHASVLLHGEGALDITTISRIVSGEKSNYTMVTCYRLCQILNVTPNAILEHERFVKRKKWPLIDQIASDRVNGFWNENEK